MLEQNLQSNAYEDKSAGSLNLVFEEMAETFANKNANIADDRLKTPDTAARFSNFL